MSKRRKNKNTVLARQHEDRNPVLDILKGAIAHLENAKACMISCDPEAQIKTLESVSSFLKDIHATGVAEIVLVKIQRPLASTETPAPFLIYNEDKSLFDHVTLEDPEIIEWFEGDPKMYVEARLWVDGTLQLMRRVEEQDW